MTITISPTQDDALEALRSFLVAVLPAGVDAIVAQQNRVPEPREGNFVVMTPLRFARLRTNVDGSADVKYTGSIAGTTMTVTVIDFGEVLVGATVFGTGIAADTVVEAQLTGAPGGAGTYAVSPSQTLPSRTLSSGAKTAEQGAQLTVQLDFHSDDQTAAGDMAQTVATLFRDPYATGFFSAIGPSIQALYADDPRQAPFINDQAAFEWRWILEAHLQVNQVVTVPQQYFDVATVDPVSVDAEFPP